MKICQFELRSTRTHCFSWCGGSVGKPAVMRDQYWEHVFLSLSPASHKRGFCAEKNGSDWNAGNCEKKTFLFIVRRSTYFLLVFYLPLCYIHFYSSFSWLQFFGRTAKFPDCEGEGDGANPKEETGQQLIIWLNFPDYYMKCKKLDRA